MENQLLTSDDDFFISAVQNEVFNRIFPKIRHDLVGNVSASLIRVSIMDRILKKDYDLEKIKSELSKIDQQLRNNIIEIRDLAFWDFATNPEDNPSDVLIKSVQLVSSQLAFKGIELKVQVAEHENLGTVQTKPCLYCLLCVFSYLEDTYSNCVFNLHLTSSTIMIKHECEVEGSTEIIPNHRHLKITEETVIKFARFQQMDIVYDDKQIVIQWN